MLKVQFVGPFLCPWSHSENNVLGQDFSLGGDDPDCVSRYYVSDRTIIPHNTSMLYKESLAGKKGGGNN